MEHVILEAQNSSLKLRKESAACVLTLLCFAAVIVHKLLSCTPWQDIVTREEKTAVEIKQMEMWCISKLSSPCAEAESFDLNNYSECTRGIQRISVQGLCMWVHLSAECGMV